MYRKLNYLNNSVSLKYYYNLFSIYSYLSIQAIIKRNYFIEDNDFSIKLNTYTNELLNDKNKKENINSF